MGGGLLVFAILAGITIFYLVWHFRPESLDAATNCPITGPVGVHAIIIDRSDPVTPLQEQQVQQFLDRAIASARAGERFDLYVADGDAVHSMKAAVSVCSPGQKREANELYQNPTRMQRTFEERFVAVLRQEIARLLEPASRASSPILETIRAVVVNSFGSVDREHLELKLTIVSDMVQHTELNSHFRGEVKFPDLERSSRWRSLQANLSDADVTILYLLRPAAITGKGRPIQDRGHQLFWEQAIRGSGGRLIRMETY